VPLEFPILIDRLFRQNVGYWQANLEGLDHLGGSDYGELLVNYLGQSEKQLVNAAYQIAADGKYELAASLLEWSTARFGRTESIAKAEHLVYEKLMEKNQNWDPFKYILYSAKIGEESLVGDTRSNQPVRDPRCGAVELRKG